MHFVVPPPYFSKSTRPRRTFTATMPIGWSWFFLLLPLLVFSSCGPKKSPKLVIATAANMQFAMTELVDEFSRSAEIPCELVIGSSGKLTAQVRAGAPFDVFVSADRRYPELLYQSGLSTAPPKIYAHGQLVLWAAAATTLPQLEDLKSDAIQHIAVANPKTAPYGLAAEQVLRQHDLYEAVAAKLVFGESIAQTNQFIISGAAEIGFTALSVVRSEAMQNQGKWTLIPPENHPPIEQGVVVLKQGKAPLSEAEKFAAFLLSDAAKNILDKFGYLTNVETTE